MSQEDRLEIEELLSGYIDGELAEQERVEIERLILHDESVAEKFRLMEKQKKLLGSLPVASAPDGLLDDITAALERRFILDESIHAPHSAAGYRGLFVRRTLTAAAMLVVVGLLGYVVLNIIMPSAGPRRETAVNDTIELLPVIEPARVVTGESFAPEPVEVVFAADLLLTTPNLISVDNFIEKAIYSSGLFDDTIPGRQSGECVYRITADASKIAVLLSELASVRDKFEKRTFTITGAAPEKGFVADGLSFSQIAQILDSKTEGSRIQIARDFTRFNSLMKDKTDSELAFEPTVPIKPVLTAGEKRPSNIENPQPSETVSLTITIKSL